MQQLRLVGVSEDGASLLCADGDGGRFALPLNDDLRAAVRRDRRAPESSDGQAKIEHPLRPRDVQGLIRGGVALEEIAERAGWSLEKVQRYEGPIRAERDYVSGLAQAVVLHGRGDSSTLRERADKRLAERDVEAERVVWDSWKSDDVNWTVVVRFPAGGRQREATWLFDPVGRALRTVDDEARWLGGDEIPSADEESVEAPKKSTKRAPRRAHEHDAVVYDVEAEGGLDDAQAPHLGAAMGSRDADAPEDLAASMRARQASRGRSKSRASTGRGSKSSAPQPTDLPGAPSGSPRVTGVERLDVGDTPPPLPSHPQPHEVEDAGDERQASAEASATAVDGADRPSTSTPVRDGAVSRETADELEAEADEAAQAKGSSRRRRTRRPRSQAEPTTVREVLTSSDDESDESLFGELPGFHDGGDDGQQFEEFDEAAEYDEIEADSVESGSVESQSDQNQVSDHHDGDEASDQDDERSSAPTSKRAPGPVPERQSQSRKNKSGRPSVPSWDDIMFGGRGPKK